MTRPLCYDDSFTNLVNEKLFANFLNCFTIRVYKTGFIKLNLLFSLIIIGIFDFTLGIIAAIVYFKQEDYRQLSLLIKIQFFFVILGVVFGLFGIKAASSMLKKFSIIYKNWRIFITIAYPLCEIFNGFYIFCMLFTNCNYFLTFLALIFWSVFNLYLTLITWSYYVRLDQSHELLIIHGRNLKKIMNNDENIKNRDKDKDNKAKTDYIPPVEIDVDRIVIKPQSKLTSYKFLL